MSVLYGKLCLACSAGAGHDSDLFSMQAQEGTVSNLVCVAIRHLVQRQQRNCCAFAMQKSGNCREKAKQIEQMPSAPCCVKHRYDQTVRTFVNIWKRAHTGVWCLRTKIVHACERERDQVLKKDTSVRTTAWLNHSGMTAEPMTPPLPGCLFGCHETLEAQIVLLQ